MEIYKLRKDWSYIIGNDRIGFPMNYKKGDRFFKVGKDYFPENGSYAVWESDYHKFVDEYFEFVEKSDKPKEYYIEKKYTQEQVDKKAKR